MFLPEKREQAIKVGIIRSSSIGDVVLASSCIQLLDKTQTPVEVFWIGKNPALDFLKKNFPLANFIDINTLSQKKGTLEKLATLDFLLDLQSNLRSRALCLAFKKTFKKPVYYCPKQQFRRFKLIFTARLFGRTRKLKPSKLVPLKLQYKVMSDSLLDALKNHLTVDLISKLNKTDHFPQFPINPLDFKNSLQKDLQVGVWLAVAPGASHQTKKAPMSIFSDLIILIRDAYLKETGSNSSFGLILLGDQNDKKSSSELIQNISWNENIIDFTGKLSLFDSSHALKAASCLLSNDSSLSHIAEAVDTPCSVLFGPTIESFGFAPRHINSRAFSTLLGCRPCSKHGKTSCRYNDKLCFTSLPLEEIANHTSKLLINEFRAKRNYQHQNNKP